MREGPPVRRRAFHVVVPMSLTAAAGDDYDPATHLRI
jgi:hypothetical protein